jgi:hypothetical protein
MSCNRILYADEAGGREKHRRFNDITFIKLIANGSLEPAFFTHEAHIRLAWLTMNTKGFEEACNAICYNIEQFDRLHGDGKKYDRKLTRAAAKIIWNCKSESESAEFADFLDEFPNLSSKLKELATAYNGNPK